MKRAHQTAHYRIWLVLGLLLPLVLLCVAALRQTVPLDRPAIKIDTAEQSGTAQ